MVWANWTLDLGGVMALLTRTRLSIAAELRAALAACRSALIAIAVASGFINVLMLTGSLFMLQVYDRVLPSRSIPTLIGLLVLAMFLFALQGMLDALRGRLLSRVGRSLAENLDRRVFGTIVDSSLAKRTPGEELQALRDLDNVRSFASSMGLPAFFDLPWMPIYVGVCFMFHPWIGVTVLVGVVLLCVLTAATDLFTRAHTRTLVAIATARREIADATRRNADVVHALGMRHRMTERWVRHDSAFLDRQEATSDIAAGFGSISRMLRMVMQSGVLALGAYLVVNQEATGGVMLAATILSIRALAPLELVIVNWRSFVTARESWYRLSELLKGVPAENERIPLPRPSRNVRVVNISVAPPGRNTPVVHEVSFALEAGSALGVIGPSGSGKSSLARALVGAWKPARGVIRIDGATYDQWNSDQLGSHVGFLPQEVELFSGTVAQNITRFQSNADPRALMAAAMAADVHNMVLRFPNGYETQIGEGGAVLSGGQRQRIALARALYGDPFLVVLDEPNSNLDAEGEKALTAAIVNLRMRGAIVVVIAHRSNVLMATDKLLVLNEGKMQAFGPRDRLIPQTVPPTRAPAAAADPAPAGATVSALPRRSHNVPGSD